MLPAYTLDEIKKSCQQNYEYGEKRIVGIMIARYTISQEIIKQQYSFWHYWTGEAVDFYWLGYGAYIHPTEIGQYLVGDFGNEVNVYFDTKVFAHGIQELETEIGLKYNDSIGILLCNFYDGRLHIDESAYIDLMYLINQYKLREFSNYLIKECKRNHDVADIIFRLRAKRVSYKLFDIKPSIFVSDALKRIINSLFGFSK